MRSLWSLNNKVLNQFSQSSKSSVKGSSVIFLIGSPLISGGTNMIFEYASALQKSGASVTIAYTLDLDEKIIAWHPSQASLRITHVESVKEEFFDLAIVTWWATVYELKQIKHGVACYFVQSLESRFYLDPPDVRLECLAAATYMCGIPMITVSPWLQNLLMSLTRTPTWLVPNGINKNTFPVAESISRKTDGNGKPLRVLVEGYRGSQIKGVDETIATLRATDLGIELWHASPSKSGGSMVADRVFEELKHQELYQVYRQVDLLVKMSRVEGMFGPPIESFHAGATAIVSKVTGFEDYIKPGVNSLTLDVDDFVGLRASIEYLQSNPDELSHMKHQALKTAQSWLSVEDSSKVFISTCNALLHSNQIDGEIQKRLESLSDRIEKMIEQEHDPRELFSPILVTSRL